ncbi:MAG: anthranilate synthase component I [Methanotrichaceae archaeon]
MVRSSQFDVTQLVNPEAPLDLYSALRGLDYPFLLESVEKSDQKARFSFVGADPEAIVTIKNRHIKVDICHQDEDLKDLLATRIAECAEVVDHGATLDGEIKESFDAFDALRSAIPCSSQPSKFGRQVFLGGGIGYLSYDLVKERLYRDSTSIVPDSQFGIFQKVFVFDHLTNKVFLAIAPFLPRENAKEMASEVEELLDELDLQTLSEPGDLGAEDYQTDEPSWFEEAVRVAKEHILDGDIFQVVLSRIARVKLKNPDPVLLYRRLRKINPSPYTYVLEFGDLAIVGASPETLFSVCNRRLTVNPIAGTCPRGGSPEEDELLARKMLDDEKERAEHVMLVDLGRNDVRSVSKSGTVNVEDFMSVLQYSHVQHIETTVRGTLRKECDQFDAARSVFPAGTLSGAPKLRALEIIDDLEIEPRGIYGGGVGYFSFDGSADFAITIRSIVLQKDVALVQAGAGIVADSDPHKEYLETEGKMAAMKSALGVSE